MKIIKGNLWTTSCTHIFVTTNSYIKTDGSLVMGRGAALEASKRDPGIAKAYGRLIPHLGVYGVLKLPGRIGLFQVKRHYAEPAELDVIRLSTDALAKWINGRQGTVALNFPGIGYGRLSREEVMPIIKRLPDSVLVYER